MIKNLKKAFTIIELVIVIAVIAILAAVMIPTYSSLVKKANLSADEQAVKQMNTALAIYTAENGKPSNGGEVKLGLSENDINADTMEPVTQGYAFYWNPTDNKIVLVGEGKATAKDGWVLLTSTGYGKLENVSSENELADKIAKSSNNEPVLIKLDANINVSKTHSEKNTKTAYCIKNDETVILDLNDRTLDFSSVDLGIWVEEGGTLSIKNGTINSNAKWTIYVNGGSLSINNVKINTKSSECGVMTVGLTDVSIFKSEIINENGYAIATNSNKAEYDGSRISITDSFIQSKEASTAGIYVGSYVNLTIDNSEISGVNYGLYLRGCNATIKNSSIYNTIENDGSNTPTTWFNGSNGYYADIVFAAGGSGYMDTGNYTCYNVTGQNGNTENFTVIVHKPNGATVNVNGITPNKTFTGANPSDEPWN